MEHEELTNSHVKYREITPKENQQLFWTKAFLQTSSYDEKRYRQISSHACERIIRKFFQRIKTTLKFYSFIHSFIQKKNQKNLH